MLGQPQAEGVGEKVVIGTRLVVVIGGVDVGDCMGNLGVGYMEVVGDRSPVVVEGVDSGACGTREDAVVVGVG